mgnify:CR=1 FL=1
MQKQTMEDKKVVSVGWHSFPVEIVGVILGFVVANGNPINAASSPGIPLRFVCKQCHTILPPRSPIHLRSFAMMLSAQGSLSLLQWAKQNGCSFLSYECCHEAAKGGHLEVLKWLRENGHFWDERCCHDAALGGHLEAAKGGHLEVLKWLRENGCRWDVQTANSAAGEGHLEVLKWAIENGCDWEESTCTMAALRGGHLEVLKWLREHGHVHGIHPVPVLPILKW